jgi:two-component system chemotaxis response regulator CheB
VELLDSFLTELVEKRITVIAISGNHDSPERVSFADKILEHQPDVMICDVQMPKMNGIEFIRRLLPQYQLPVIVVSTISNAVFDAMNAGAVDFVTKPDMKNPKSMDDFIRDLIVKIKVATKAKVALPQSLVQKVAPSDTFNYKKIIAMGASTGGTEALYNILKCLPSNVVGIVIVQHIPPVFSNMFAQRLNTQTQLNVKEAQTW